MAARIRVDSVGLDTGLNGEDMARRADQDVTRLHEPAMRVVATYPNYREAQAAVDYLSDQDFPVEKVRIVGRGFRLVEQATGGLGIKEAALRGLVAGALVDLWSDCGRPIRVGSRIWPWEDRGTLPR